MTVEFKTLPLYVCKLPNSLHKSVYACDVLLGNGACHAEIWHMLTP